MRHFLGIYGFEFSNKIQLNGLHLTPITTSESEAKKLAESTHELNLTGIGEFTDCKEQDLPSSEIDKFWHLPGILTFCQQREVLLSLTFSEPDDIEIQNIFENLPRLTKIR